VPQIPTLQVVWFKRDLRVYDHRPLVEAVERGPVLPLYIVEPSVVEASDFSGAHWTFVRECLAELRARLADRGQPLVVRRGEAVATFQRLYDANGPFTLWAHQETGTRLTFDRDRAVRAWANERGLSFHEPRQQGVIRGPHDRDHWRAQWEQFTDPAPLSPPDTLRPVPVRPGPLPTTTDLGLSLDGVETLQSGGEAAAHRTLRSFLHTRGRHYPSQMSSPQTAYRSCSRLSPHFAWGTLSLRTAHHRIQDRRDAVRALAPDTAHDWRKSLSSLESRLHWHDHFTQKLEDAPRIEHESFIPAFDALREDEHETAREEAWAAGQTGYPLVDACMRALRATGYLNFRMRALLVSFASYDLWLDWRQFHDVLARRWIDYVPGIHFSQLQMQSGTTGINAVRVYNPTKQAREQDPGGAFIRRWVPALGAVPTPYIHEPWLMPANVQQKSGCEIGTDYPAPIVKHAAAAKRAKDRIFALRDDPSVQDQADEVLEEHGSRRGSRSRASSSDSPHNGTQQQLDL
jgi:deoxyribodipyrimidine photo-lyase